MACETSKKDKLIVVIKAKVEPTPELIELLRRYRNGLNMAIKWAVEVAKAKGRVPTLSEIHKALYKSLKAMGLPSAVAATCNREALAVARSYLAKGTKGKSHRHRGEVQEGEVERSQTCVPQWRYIFVHSGGNSKAHAS